MGFLCFACWTSSTSGLLGRGLLFLTIFLILIFDLFLFFGLLARRPSSALTLGLRWRKIFFVLTCSFLGFSCWPSSPLLDRCDLFLLLSIVFISILHVIIFLSQYLLGPCLSV